MVTAICLAALVVSLPNFYKVDSRFFPQSTFNLGLDLRGGSYLLLEVDTDSYMKEQLQNLRNEVRAAFRGKKANGERIRYNGGIRTKDGAVHFQLTNAAQTEEVEKIVKKLSQDYTVEADETGHFVVGFSEDYVEVSKKNVLEQSIEIVRRRVDETGTREPDIQRQGDDRILLQVPGLKDPEQLKRLLGKTAKLTFHLVDPNFPFPDTTRAHVPPSSARLKSDDDANVHYTIQKRVMVSGDELVDARPAYNNMGQPVVNIRFNSIGSKKFGDVTKKNLNKPFAIVLDNKVITAPVIRGVILGGTAEISGSFTTESANDLAILLRAGSLPAPINVIEERTVGPSLGADSIAAGKKAMLIAIVLVVIFMGLSYGLFGIFSNVALLTNIVLITAVLSLFGATLTLPGIAGIVLTMGMAVDANVLIFERIREETRLGKTPYASVDNGFKQAFKTILDANITTLIAAILLYNFGSGPIKGFAVTLSVGILTSMFSAILLTRMLVVTWLKSKRPNTLPI
jgi:preprotein translocase subunit SecD